MFTQFRVVHWLVLAATMLLIVGAFAYQRVGRRAADRGVGESTVEVAASQTVVVASSAAALLSVLIAGLQMRRESRRRQRVEIALENALASVEQQVSERTEALSQAMASLRASEQLKDEFLATASHELRTPLNAIVGWVHVLQSGAPLDAGERQHAVDAIARNAKVQTRLIEDLLDVSRMIQGRLSLTVAPLDARIVVDAALEAIRLTASAKALTVQVANPIEPVPVVADAHRLQQVVWNLLANAVKYTPQGGTITVGVKAERGQAVISVSDTGEGIDAAFLPHIFEPFRQGAASTMRTGMGLGLAIVQRLVDLHGGHLTVESPGCGKGSRFTVSLPLASTDALGISRSVTADPALQKLHVLVAEDDADSAAAVTAILRMHGCETQTAGTAAECLKISAEWPPDVLVCDIGLPDDDGYGLLRRLRRQPAGKRIPAIALTAYARPEDRARALAAGFRAHLSKPLDPAILLSEISSAVRATALTLVTPPATR